MTDQPDQVEGSPMMQALVDSAQIQAAQFAAGADLSVLTSTSLANSLRAIPAAGSIAMSAAIGVQDFNTSLPSHSSDSMQQYVSAAAQQQTYPEPMDTQQHHHDITSVLCEQPQLAEGDVSADPQSLRFNYSVADSPLPRVGPRGHKKGRLVVYREQDRFVPINNVSRVMRKAIPKNGKVSKDAKECMQECVSEFVSFLTSEASDRCIDEKRKTVTGDDILFALSTLGFDNYVKPLQIYLKKYREFLKEDKQQQGTRQEGGDEEYDSVMINVVDVPEAPSSSVCLNRRTNHEF